MSTLHAPVPVIQVNPATMQKQVTLIPLEDIDDLLEDILEDYELGFGELGRAPRDRRKVFKARLRVRTKPVLKITPGQFGVVPINPHSLIHKRAAMKTAGDVAALAPDSSKMSARQRAVVAAASRGTPKRSPRHAKTVKAAVVTARAAKRKPVIIATPKHGGDSPPRDIAKRHQAKKYIGGQVPMHPGIFKKTAARFLARLGARGGPVSDKVKKLRLVTGIGTAA